jgi:hypothetical protein
MAFECDKHLPGGPSKRLVRDVRRHLSSWGIRPGLGGTEKHWRAAWAWADQIASSYSSWMLHRRRKQWPRPTEIACQYLTILVRSIGIDGMLRLPYRAGEQMPAAVATMIGVTMTKPLELGHEDLANMDAEGTRAAGGSPPSGDEHAADRQGDGPHAAVSSLPGAAGSDTGEPSLFPLA